VTAVPGWVRQLADEHLADGHTPGCQGTLRYITPQARLRGAAAVRCGESVSLSRPLQPGVSVRADELRPTFALQTFARSSRPGHTTGSDWVEVDCHGMANTHLDGLTHVGLEGSWHGGRPSTAPGTGPGESLLIGAKTGIATRVVCLDITAQRGTAWVTGDPVGAGDLDAALDAAGTDLEPGDAVLVYMGRDAYEAAGHVYGPIGKHPDGRSGLGSSGTRWLADRKVSLLCWDFLDAHGPGLDLLPAHAVTWAVGLVLIDNCHLGPAVRALAEAGSPAGLLMVGPLRMHGATGSVVNPVMLY
jgi:kynurenine formamidase